MMNKKRHLHKTGWLVVWLLLLAGCSTDEQPPETADDLWTPDLEVTEQAWEVEHLHVTRAESAEDEDALATLKEKGFGVYAEVGYDGGKTIRLTNEKVVWENGKWGYKEHSLLWRIDKDKPVNVYAYAPYEESPAYDEASHVLTFTASAEDNKTDLMWASKEGAKRADETKEVVPLQFHHALAKLSFGTVKNETGHDVRVNKITLKGQLYKTGKLSLEDGTWSGLSLYGGDQTITRSETPALEVDSHREKAMGMEEFLLIPSPKVTLTLDFTLVYDETSTKDLTAQFDVALEQEKNKEINITLKNNFEVVIKD